MLAGRRKDVDERVRGGPEEEKREVPSEVLSSAGSEKAREVKRAFTESV